MSERKYKNDDEKSKKIKFKSHNICFLQAVNPL